MGSEDDAGPSPVPETSSRRRRSSPDEDGEAAAAAEGEEVAEGSKRRKHHHHSHHRHHRHSSSRHHGHHHRRGHRDKHGREGDEEEEGELPPPPLPPPVTAAGADFSGVHPVLPPPPPLFPGTAVFTAADLDEREEGEICEDEEVGFPGAENGEVLPMGSKTGACEPGELMPDDAGAQQHLEVHISGEGAKEMAIERGTDEGACQSSRSHGNIDDAEEDDKDNGYGVACLRSSSLLDVNGYREPRAKGLEREAASSSPVSGGSPTNMKEKDRNRHEIIVSEHNVERRRTSRRSESRSARGYTPENRMLSLSPEGSKDKGKARGCSPSYGQRENSRSHDHARERSYEQSTRIDTDRTDHVDLFGMRDKVRGDSDRERGSRHDRLYHHDNVDRMKGMENDKLSNRDSERGSSRGRHDGREDRYGSRDGGRDREKDRGMGRDRDGEKLSDTTREKGRERETMRDSHRDREHSRDVDREKERDGRYREREKSRDIDREKGRDREKVRTRGISRERERDGGGRERDSGRDRVRDQEIPRDRDRDRVRQIEKDRARSRDRFIDSKHLTYDEREHHRDRTRSKESTKEPGSRKLEHGVRKETSTREEDEEEYKERIEQRLAEQEEEDPEKIIEESRRRRLAILEKYKQQQLQQPKELHSEDHGKEEKTNIAEDTKQSTVVETKSPTNVDNGYLPDVVEDSQDAADVYVADQSFSVGRSPQQNGASAQGRMVDIGGLGDGTPKSEQLDDMFCDDIFGESPTGVRKPGKGDDLKIIRSGLHDNWDDAEGYYIYRFGEVLDNRYEVIASHGKGVFSTVVRAKDLKAGKDDPEEVAIKIIRNNDTMYKAGLEELTILKKLVGADPDDKRHCVRFLSSFKYRNHLCLVFESLHMNLREVLKKFGRNIGLKLTAVRAYAKQLFIALKHLRNCGVLHCDIKPDNMLVNEAKNVLKLCDFGNAMFAGKNEITPYLVSRFYRAPEIILGLPYDHPLDMWSVGCCLYELYSGKVLFPGPTNNDMLRLHMELKGPFPKKMLRKGAFADQHFDQDLNFHATEEDPVTKKAVKRLLLNIKLKDIGALIATFPGEDPKMLAHFKDLLERIFILDPEKRMTVAQALSHPFITGK